MVNDEKDDHTRVTDIHTKKKLKFKETLKPNHGKVINEAEKNTSA